MTAVSYQLAIVGAGPAGIAAALEAAACGARVALFDQQPRPGGQIYRDVERGETSLLGEDYASGKDLVAKLRRAEVHYFPSSRVWHLETGSLGVLTDGVTREYAAERVLIATGAQERPMPIPGWQLPGVMGAGAAQVLLKSATLVPSSPPLLAGCGPLLWLLAWQYLRAGVEIGAIVDTAPRGNRWPALAKLPRALAAADYLVKGLGLIGAVKRARVPCYRHATALAAHGESRLQALEFDCAGRRHRLGSELLLLHHGVIPVVNIADAAGCRIGWSETQQCWRVEVDAWGQTSVPGIFAAGDGAAIGGARVAQLSGSLAGLQIAFQLGLIDQSRRNRLARPLFRARARHLAVRPFLDAYYRLGDANLLPPDETLVCRCEEVSAGEIRAVAARGCSGPNQAKAFTRCGMGPCQGRLCGATVEQLFARERGVGVDAIGRYRARPPLQPITLGQLAASPGDENE